MTIFQFLTKSKTTIVNRYLLLPLFASVMFASCQKTGPAGPAGSANVIYSDWFTPASYTKSTVFGITNLDYNKPAPGITQEIMDKGVVLTYGKLTGYNSSIWPAGQVSQLPVSVTYVSGSTMTDTWTAYATPGNLRINFVNNTNYYSAISNSHSFRYIIIPGGNAGGVVSPTGTVSETTGQATGTTAGRPDFRSMSYDQVCDYLKIPR